MVTKNSAGKFVVKWAFKKNWTPNQKIIVQNKINRVYNGVAKIKPKGIAGWVEDMIESATCVWARYVDIQFVETQDYDQADLKIAFAFDRCHDLDGNRQTGGCVEKMKSNHVAGHAKIPILCRGNNSRYSRCRLFSQKLGSCSRNVPSVCTKIIRKISKTVLDVCGSI